MFAYIGPGAGFALLSSALAGIIAALVAVVSLLIWPFRILWGIVRRKRRAPPSIGRLVVLGFEAQDPPLTDRWLEEGRLPNLRRLADAGGYRHLRSSGQGNGSGIWSAFSTGAGGGDQEPFWSVLADHGVWSTILRVPLTAPPKKFAGAQLYAWPASAEPHASRPLSHPKFFASYLRKRLGSSGTFGLGEATGAAADRSDAEREAMLLLALDQLRSGSVVSAFATFREQHDALVGRVLARLTAADLLIVFSESAVFSSRPLATDAPSVVDLAPTVLRLFGVNPPPYMQGEFLFRETPAGAAA